MTPDRAFVAVDTLAQDAMTGEKSEGAKLLLIPQHNIVVAGRGSGQFFLRLFSLCLEASFRRNFTIEQIMREVGPVMDRLWPKYLDAARIAQMELDQLQSEFMVVGWSQAQERIVGAAYSKSDVERPELFVELMGGIAAPGQQLRDLPESFEPDAIRAAGRRQADYVNARKDVRSQVGGLLPRS